MGGSEGKGAGGAQPVGRRHPSVEGVVENLECPPLGMYERSEIVLGVRLLQTGHVPVQFGPLAGPGPLGTARGCR